MESQVVKKISMILAEELAERCKRNTRYSLRAFARDLGMSPARVSMVLSDRKGLSRTAAAEIARKLAWTKEQSEHFCDLADSVSNRSGMLRLEAVRRLADREQAKLGDSKILSKRSLTEDQFQLVSDWHSYAVFALLFTEGARYEADWIAKQLGTSVHVVRDCLSRLERLGMTVEGKGLNPEHPGWFHSTDGVPSQALRSFHESILAKAKEALFTQNVDQRDFQAMVLAISERQIPEFREKVHKFLDELQLFVSAEQKRDRVINFSTQFFQLNQVNNPLAPVGPKNKEKVK